MAECRKQAQNFFRRVPVVLRRQTLYQSEKATRPNPMSGAGGSKLPLWWEDEQSHRCREKKGGR